MNRIDQRAAFDFVRYASVWEDADLLSEALAPVAPGGRLLAIASAGDNALALLTLDPAAVVAVDLNPAQVACLELRRAAFRRLDYEELLRFLGVTASDRRWEAYRRLRADLAPEVAAFWDARPAGVARGIIHGGKFERYLEVFRRRVLPFVHRESTVRALLACRSLEEQRAFYRDRWDTWRWRAMFRVFFSRHLMGRLGRDPAFFDQVEGRVAERILERTRFAFTETPVAGNPYLARILTGNYPPDALPLYLRPRSFEPIRRRLDRLEVRTLPADQARGPFDGMNLSDIFEYMPAAEHARVYRALVDQAAPGARLVYWNLLAPRDIPPGETRTRSLGDLAGRLHGRDRTWFYQWIHVDEVAAPEAPETPPLATMSSTRRRDDLHAG